jgi:PAS domain S-box-containing protein
VSDRGELGLARRRLAAIVHAQREIAECGADLDEALQMVVARTCALTDADASFLYFLDGDELVIRATSNEQKVPLGDRQPLDASLSGLALRTGAAQATGDSMADSRVAVHWRDGLQRSLVLVPLASADGDVPAVLAIMRERRDAFDDQIVDTVRLMAEFAAIALRNAADGRQRQRLLDALGASEERFRNAIQSSPIGFALCTPDDRYLVVNDAYCRIVGRTREELERMTWRELTHEVDLEAEEIPAEQLVAGMVPHLELEKRLQRGDGQIIWVRVFISMVRADDGSAAYGLAQVQDITEQRLLEQSVRERERLFRSVFEQSLLGNLLHDDDGAIVDANERAAELVGIPREQLIGNRFADFAAEPGALDEHWRTMVTEGFTEAEVDIRGPAGSRRIIFSARANVQPGRHLVTVQDVTEQRRLEERLRESQKLEAIGRLAGGIAHDFNNMLTTISGYAQLLLTQLGARDDQREFARQIDQASQRATALTRQLLAFSRQQVLQPEVLDLNAVVERMSDVVGRLIGDSIRLETDLAPDAAHVVADEGKLEQVVVNVAANARDAMPHGGHLRIETATVELADGEEQGVPAGRYTTLTITDSGVGMDAEQLERLFDPFYSTKSVAGVGLGLATVYGIVTQSGGHITVSSEAGRGARFRIYLPASEQHALRPVAPEHVSPEALAGSRTVLLVEDEPAVRSVVAEMLEGSGYAVLTAGDGREALALSAAHDGEIDLLVTDVVMPGMSGQEVARRIVAERPSTRTLFVSGYNVDAIQQHGVLAPGAGFLEKPFSAADLAQKAREVLDGAGVMG